MKISAVLFDMDGVIISTRKEIEAFWHYWAEKANIQLTGADIENYVHGCPPERTLTALFPHIDEAFKLEMERDSLRIGKNVKDLVMPGVLRFMADLDNLSVPYGIVTSHTLASAKRIVTQLKIEEKYKTLVTVDQVKQGKPAPDCYLLAASRLNIPKEEILVFEDSVSGCMSALSAGMNVIGVNTAKYAKSLMTLGVKDVVEDFSCILSVLKNSGISFPT